MKIVLFDYIFDQQQPGISGLSDLIWETARGLVDIGEEVHIVGPYPVGISGPNGATLHTYPLPRLNYHNLLGHLLIIWRGWRVIQRELSDADLIHTPEYLSSSVFTLMGKIPVILTTPGSIYERIHSGANPFDPITTAIYKLADRHVPSHPAVSLHAPNDALRNELVPVSQKIGIAPILAAADRFFEVTGRRITYEYVLLADINDAPHQAEQLARLLRGRNALVNVIPFNPVEGLPYRTPSELAVRRFVRILEDAGLQIQVRKRKGDAIDAACGQLRRSAAGTPPVVGLTGGASFA